MKVKIENIEELTDSRQIMENKPNKFMFVFIILVLVILVISFVWLWYGEKEEVIKVSGTVILKEQTQVVTNEINGVIKDINYNNGEYVKKGEILYTLDRTEFEIQKENLEKQKAKLKTRNESLDKFIESINSRVNYFEENGDEKEFYYKYKNYELENLELESGEKSLENSENEIIDRINELDDLKQSIEEDINYNDDDSFYSEKYNNYEISKEEINNKIAYLSEELEEIQNEDKEKAKQIEKEITTNRSLLEKLKSDIKLEIDTEKETLNEQRKKIEKENENSNVSKEKNRIMLIAQIEEEKKINNEEIDKLDNSIKEININIEKCFIRANREGKIEIRNELHPGMIVQSGFLLGEIVNKQKDLEVKLVILDKDIGKLKINQKIKYSINALPYMEFGFANGKIKKLGLDSNKDESSGVVYYIGIGNLEEMRLQNYDGERVDIKSGMTCEARIITGKKRMIYYLLDKLNIKIK